MESKIYEKFQIDEINPVAMFYKDNLKNLRPSKFTFLKEEAISNATNILVSIRKTIEGENDNPN